MTEAVSISGLLLNLLDTGFRTQDNVGEMIDNSFGSGAKKIRITLDSSTSPPILVFSDNGAGMTLKGLESAHILHNRSDPSATKDGRFGIGGAHARSHFTQNKGSVLTISKSEEVEGNPNAGLSQASIDYTDSVKTNKLVIKSGEITVPTLPKWQKYAINPAKKGTVVIIECAQNVLKELLDMINTTVIRESLLYTLGCNYHQSLLTGSEISILKQVEKKELKVLPIDPLVLKKMLPQHKREVRLQYCADKVSGQKFVYFLEDAAWQCRRINPKSGKLKNFPEAPTNLRKIGELTLICAYSDKWLEIQKDDLKAMSLVIPSTEDSNKEYQELLSGLYIQRNSKINAHFPIARPDQGDYDKRPFIVNCHFLVKFTASDEMDQAFKVLTNKSKLQENQIEKNLYETLEFLRGQFINDQHKKWKNSQPAPPPAPAAPAGPPAPPPVAPAPVPPVAPPVAPAPVAPAPVAPAPVHPVVPRPNPVAPIAPVPQPQPQVDIHFSKTDAHVIILEKGTRFIEIRYRGQYHIAEKYYTEHLMALGPQRFKEWILAVEKINRLLE